MVIKRRRGDSADFALSQSQTQKTLHACVDIIDRVTIGLQLFCGLRISEVVHFNSSWITQQGELKIPAQQECACAECARIRDGLWKPKTKSGARTLPISKRIRQDLADLLRMQPHGLGMSRVALYGRTKAVLKRANVKFKGLAGGTGFPHCLRSTCAQMLALSGIESSALCYAMGWKSIAVGDHYIRAARAKDLAMKQMKAAFG